MIINKIDSKKVIDGLKKELSDFAGTKITHHIKADMSDRALKWLNKHLKIKLENIKMDFTLDGMISFNGDIILYFE